MAPKRRDPNYHLISGQPVMFEPPEAFAQASAKMNSLLKGKVVGFSRVLPQIVTPVVPTANLGVAPVPLVNLTGPDDEAMVVTVGLMGPPQGVATNMQFSGVRAVAVLQWGCGGATSQMEVDFSAGSVFSIPVSSIQIGGYIQREIGDAVLADPLCLFGAFVALGNANRQTPLTKTVSAGDIGPAGAASIFVPPFAKMVRITGAPLVANPPAS